MKSIYETWIQRHNEGDSLFHLKDLYHRTQKGELKWNCTAYYPFMLIPYGETIETLKIERFESPSLPEEGLIDADYVHVYKMVANISKDSAIIAYVAELINPLTAKGDFGIRIELDDVEYYSFEDELWLHYENAYRWNSSSNLNDVLLQHVITLFADTLIRSGSRTKNAKQTPQKIEIDPDLYSDTEKVIRFYRYLIQNRSLYMLHQCILDKRIRYKMMMRYYLGIEGMKRG